MIASSKEVGSALCKIFGLNPKKVTRLEIVIQAGEPVVINSSQYMFEGDEHRMVEVLSEYALERTDKTSEITGRAEEDFKPTFQE